MGPRSAHYPWGGALAPPLPYLLGVWELHLPHMISFFTPLAHQTGPVLHRGGIWKVVAWERGGIFYILFNFFVISSFVRPIVPDSIFGDLAHQYCTSSGWVFLNRGVEIGRASCRERVFVDV